MNNWLNFFASYFPNVHAAEEFISRCESLSPDDRNHKAKIMMHQTQRLVSIADDLPKIRPSRESLQLLFLMICIEHISKLHDDFTGEGQSKKYVKRFFTEFISKSDKDKLGTSFIDNTALPMSPLGFEKVVDLLYAVRCDVVHEGKYWGFSFHDGSTPMVNVDPDVNVYLTFQELRDIIVKGCINAIKDKLKP
jgi:hypothetical protein